MAKKKLWVLIAAILALLAVAAAAIWLIPGFVQPGNEDEMPEEKGIQPQVVSHAIVGAWARDRGNDSKIGPQKSYDEFIGTYWNPQAPGNYQGEPGIVYLLNGYYDLTDVTVYFANREYFFKLYVSTDCQEFTQVFEVNADNMAQVFDSGFCCRITGLDAKNVAFLKLEFTGSYSSDNNTYISLRHISFNGTRLQDGPDKIPIETKVEEKKKSIIADYLITGAWIRDRQGDSTIGPTTTFDGNDYTCWNPQASGNYQGKPGIVYMLNGYYDLDSLRIITDKREYYMQVYTSTDGYEFTQIADITAANYTEYYDGLTCLLADLDCKDVGYIKLVFTGSNSVDNNTYLSLAEVEPAGTKLAKDAPTQIPDTEPKVNQNAIAAHRVSGSWIRDREDMESLSPAKTYDKNVYSYWNPQANGGYAGNPGIVYRLNGYYDVEQIQLIFGTREYYFEVYTSSDGYNYKRVAKVTSSNMKNYYQDLTVTLTDVNAKDVGYVKVVFTGSNSRDNNTYVSLMEAVVTGTKLDKEAPTTIPNTDVKLASTKIRSHMIVGSWIRDREDTDSLSPKRSYDENLYAGWNPQTNSSYAGKPGIIYRLKNFYDITKIKLNFDKREYFFQIYTSVDGLNFDLLATVNKDNMAQFYNGLTCTFQELECQGVGYIKLVFTGSNSADNNTYISLMEVQITGEKAGTSTPGKIPQQPEEDQAAATIVADHKVTGQWVRDREDTPSLAPDKTYDENLYAGWNPQANSGYSGEPGIVYMLNGYYDLTDVKLTFDKREYFFKLFTSADGETFVPVAEVNVDNYADYYDGLTATFAELNLQDVGYVKIQFTGSNSGDNNTYISLMEVQFAGTKLSKDAPTQIPDEPAAPEDDEPKAVIVSNQVVGSWANDRVGTNIGPERTYDGNLTTNWNPAVTGFTSEAAIVYTLDKSYDLTKLELTFGSRHHYITVSVSANGQDFTELATINSGNAADYYQDLVCTLAELTAQNVKYVKVSFIGTANGTTWINLMEVKVFGTEAVGGETPEVTEPETTEPETTEPETSEPETTEPETTEPAAEQEQATILSNQVVGSWANDRVGTNIGPERTYDGNLTTNWNPAVSGFTSEAAIVYTLDKSYDLTKLELTFGSRHHYITVSVSANGQDFTELATVNSGNAADYYQDLVCTLAELTAQNVKYVKVSFIGTANGTTWINLMEVKAFGTEAVSGETPEPSQPETSEPEISANITAYQVVGSWVRDRDGDSRIGPQQSFDADVASIWNPQATNYNSGEGIIYTLDQAYDLSKVTITFGTRQYYFTLYVSTDGETFTQVAEVKADNAAEYFEDLVCTLQLEQLGVTHIQILFTGSANGTTYISVADVKIAAKETPLA